MRSLLVTTLLVFLLTGASRPARAADGDWYGWQTLLTDGGALGLFALASADSRDNGPWPAVFVAAGVSAYLLGGPIVHLFRGGPVGKSVAARLLLPLAGIPVGFLVDGILFKRSSDPCRCAGIGNVGPGVVGFFAGGATAAVIDAAFFAYEPVVARPRLAVAPLIGPDRTRGLLLAMRF